MNTANGEPEIDPEYYTELRPLDENVLFAVSDPQVITNRPWSKAEIDELDNAISKMGPNDTLVSEIVRTDKPSQWKSYVVHEEPKKQLTGAEIEAMEDEAAKRKKNVLERFKRVNAKTKPTVTFDEKTYPVESVTIDYNHAWQNAAIPDDAASWSANWAATERNSNGPNKTAHNLDGSLHPVKVNRQQTVVYLAGPMTGYDNYNFPAFDAARDDLTAKGFKVVSPADIDREVGFDPSVGTLDDFDLPAAIRRDVDAILGCDAVVLLPGHESSKGATAERYVAKWAGVPCYTYPELKPYDEEQVDNNLFAELASEIEQQRKAFTERLDASIVYRQPDTTGPLRRPVSDPRNILEGHKSVVTESPKTDAKPSELRDGDTVTNERGGKQSFISAAFDCIPPECLKLLAQCLGFGKKKYGKDNWKQIDQEDNIAHAMNHLNEYRLGDRSEPHLVNAMARVTFALSQAVANGTQSDVYVHPDQK